MDEKLKNTITNSVCFGLAYEDEVPECKQCDARLKCRAGTPRMRYSPEPIPKLKLPKVDIETKKGLLEKL